MISSRARPKPEKVGRQATLGVRGDLKLRGNGSHFLRFLDRKRRAGFDLALGRKPRRLHR